jgi:hypothetical protein
MPVTLIILNHKPRFGNCEELGPPGAAMAGETIREAMVRAYNRVA